MRLLASILVAASVGLGALPDAATASAPAVVEWVLIGDSITAGNVNLITPHFAGLPKWFIEAQSGRLIDKRLVAPTFTASSGLDAVARVKALGHRPSLWVIELGTNDVYRVQKCGCPDPVAFAGEKIDSLRAAIGFDQRIVWINVRNAVYPVGTAALNRALRDRFSPTFGIADWQGLSEGHDDWFVDPVHPSFAGTQVFGAFVADIVRNPPFRQIPSCPIHVPNSGLIGQVTRPATHGYQPALRCRAAF